MLVGLVCVLSCILGSASISVGATVEYRYDKLGRLTAVQRDSSSTSYVYDRVGNRVGYQSGGCPLRATVPVGTNVTVRIGCNTRVTFGEVTSGGTIEFTTFGFGGAAPGGMVILPPSTPMYYEVSIHGAEFTGPVVVRMSYDPSSVVNSEDGVTLFQYVETLPTPGWVPITGGRDVETNEVWGNLYAYGDGIYSFGRLVMMECSPTGVDDQSIALLVPTLRSCIPNPFRASTVIGFSLAKADRVNCQVFDVAGRVVRTLMADMAMPPGQHTVAWDGLTDLGQPAPSGIYFYRLKAGSFEDAKKAVLLR